MQSKAWYSRAMTSRLAPLRWLLGNAGGDDQRDHHQQVAEDAAPVLGPQEPSPAQVSIAQRSFIGQGI